MRPTHRQVTAQSSDEEIFAAINAMGEHRYPWRKGDWPKPGENYQKAWVKPTDIGYSRARDRSLVKRLHRLVKEGKLEVAFTSRARNISPPIFAPCYQDQNGMPRFRVVPQ